MRHNPFADAMSVIKNAEKSGKTECTLKITSNVLMSVLEILKKEGYIDDFKVISKLEGGKIKVILNGAINYITAIVPRFYIKKDEYTSWEKKFLPAVGTGLLIVSTSEGIKTNNEVKGRIGGSLIAYVY